MYEFRELTENKVIRGIGIALICIVLGLGTYLLMYQPDSNIAVQVGNQSTRTAPEPAVTPPQSAPLEISANVMPTSTPTIPPEPGIPPRSSFTLKVQNAGGSAESVQSTLEEAVALGYQAQMADVPGKALTKTVIRHKPGLDAAALRAAADLAPGALLEAHADISVDLVVAVGKS
ncbi:MAG: hypothetical protein DCC49_06870 [Acidobacteria bacterium]|nr:MAG: hypothetical protein DCC49_06870 [Acidobacteriota bacterium]